MADRFAGLSALLLAGGAGIRLRPLNDTIPNCLVPLGGRSLIDFWVDTLARAGVTQARINTHSHAEAVRAYIARVNAAGRLSLVESYEPTVLGSAGTVTANANLADDGDDIVIVHADNLSDIDLRPLIAFHRDHGDPLTMVLFRTPNPRACGIAELDEEGRITAFVEKPEQPKSDLANAGLYVVNAAAYREIAAMSAFDLGFDVLPQFVGRMRGWVWGGYHLAIGTHEALERGRRDVRSIFPDLPTVSPETLQPAIFLDRDGTLIEHVHYLADPKRVRLIAGAADALRRFRRGGFARVLVTNQSAIARGMLTEEGLHEIHAEMNRQLAAAGASLDAIYYCADAPVSDDRTTVEKTDRKPGPGMLRRAAADLKLDLKASWMIGDLVSDVLAGENAGCRSILLESGQTTPEETKSLAGRFATAKDLPRAAELILD
jgi:D,D-heptose 1,7-bisphosphate phosphatase